jgi:hypothetical protein
MVPEVEMRTSAFAIFVLMAVFLSPGTAISQGFEIGPGGVRVSRDSLACVLIRGRENARGFVLAE